MITIIENARLHDLRRAVISDDREFTYRALLLESEKIALALLNGRPDLLEARIAFLVQPGFDYVCIQWGIWRAGGVAVPLCTKHPLPSLQYVIEDTEAETVIFSPEFESLLAPMSGSGNTQLRSLASFRATQGSLPDVTPGRRAMILYTSGTTGKPKGVVTTHDNIDTQITSLTTAWKWSKDDHILNILPLHHVHGIINVMSCALYTGACCQFLPKFNPETVFSIFLKGEVNVFMAVPTIYFKLISHWNTLPVADQSEISKHLKAFRLMVSGSAALPVSVLEQWEKISGHTLLERYGMTEMGMAISNPYDGVRTPGHIGMPLSNVLIRITDEQGQSVEPGDQGEIQVKGPNVFTEYWRKPRATEEAFTADGWFRTGDVALVEDGSYRILGRNSVDIIKSGGYKISALEIEEVLRSHPEIKECGVVGIPDDEWGEIICASLILDGQELNLEKLKTWLREKLPSYKIPRKYLISDSLPRNVMGKVTKQILKKQFANY